VAWQAITPPPPAWLSTRKLCLSKAPQRSVTVRPTMSLPPPADTGTM
jgi:hypothetical protein